MPPSFPPLGRPPPPVALPTMSRGPAFLFEREAGLRWRVRTLVEDRGGHRRGPTGEAHPKQSSKRTIAGREGGSKGGRVRCM